MRLLLSSIMAVVAAIGTVTAQTPASTVDTYLSTAKTAAGTDWAGTFLRLCIAPAAAPAGGRGVAGRAGGAGRVEVPPPGKRGMPNRPK